MNLEDCDFVKSDHCGSCGGLGYAEYDGDYDQCEECEDLHRAEIRAGRMMDRD